MTLWEIVWVIVMGISMVSLAVLIIYPLARWDADIRQWRERREEEVGRKRMGESPRHPLENT